MRTCNLCVLSVISAIGVSQVLDVPWLMIFPPPPHILHLLSAFSDTKHQSKRWWKVKTILDKEVHLDDFIVSHIRKFQVSNWPHRTFIGGKYQNGANSYSNECKGYIWKPCQRGKRKGVSQVFCRFLVSSYTGEMVDQDPSWSTN